VESLSAELLFGMSLGGFNQKEQKEKPSDWMVSVCCPNNFEPLSLIAKRASIFSLYR
jgi:hypothetical protein